MGNENVKKGKGLLSNLISNKSKKNSCCCGGFEIEEIPEEEKEGKDNLKKSSKDKN